MSELSIHNWIVFISLGVGVVGRGKLFYSMFRGSRHYLLLVIFKSTCQCMRSDRPPCVPDWINQYLCRRVFHGVYI